MTTMSLSELSHFLKNSKRPVEVSYVFKWILFRAGQGSDGWNTITIKGLTNY